MKFIAAIVTFLFIFNSHAGLITTASDHANYNTGDLVSIDFFVNDLNPSVDFLDISYYFDNTLLTLDEFSWSDSPEIIGFGAFGLVSSDIFDPSIFYINLGFLHGFSDVLGTTFKLGQLQFTALSDSVVAELSLTNVIAFDFAGAIVEPQSVSEPSGYVLLSLIGGLFLMRKRARH